MPVLVAWIVDAVVWLFTNRIGFMIVSFLAWAGITYGTQKIVTTEVVSQLQSFFSSMGSGGSLGAASLAWLGVLNLDKAMTMIVSCITTKQGLSALRIHILKR